jgi:hypothetical protein
VTPAPTTPPPESPAADDTDKTVTIDRVTAALAGVAGRESEVAGDREPEASPEEASADDGDTDMTVPFEAVFGDSKPPPRPPSTPPPPPQRIPAPPPSSPPTGQGGSAPPQADPWSAPDEAVTGGDSEDAGDEDEEPGPAGSPPAAEAVVERTVAAPQSPIAGPAGEGDDASPGATGGGSGSNRLAWVVAGLLVLVLGVAGVMALFSGGPDDEEASGSASTTVPGTEAPGSTVATGNPSIAVTVPESLEADEGSEVVLPIDLGPMPDGGDAVLSVDWGDGSEAVTATAAAGTTEVGHVYSDNGDYTVSVSATGPGSAAGSAASTVTVRNVSPTVAINGPPSGDAAAALAFEVTVTDPGNDGHELVVSWGDDQAVTVPVEQNPTVIEHTWASGGNYEIGIVVSDDDGGAGNGFHAVAIRRATSDVAIFTPATAQWTVYGPSTTVEFVLGERNDVPLLGDWNCDGVDTPGVFRPAASAVYVRNATGEGPFEGAFDTASGFTQAVAGDFDGNGCDEVALRNSGGRVFVTVALGDATVALRDFFFGDPGDVLMAGDFDGDGIDELGLYRPSASRFLLETETASGVPAIDFVFGSPGDEPVAGDWDGDGVDSVGTFRDAADAVYLRNGLGEGVADVTLAAGATGVPVAGRTLIGE